MTQNILYRLDNTDFEALKTYCVQNQPSTSSLLGWLLNAPCCSSNEISSAILYCSAANPWHLIQNKTVVWLIKLNDRIRIFVSSEPFLNQCPTTELAQKYFNDSEASEQGAMFIDPDHQRLYIESEKLLESVLNAFMETENQILVHGVSILWSPLLRRSFKILFNGPCQRFINPTSRYPLAYSLPSGYTINKAEKEHCPLIIKFNKIKYDMQYVIDGLDMSTVINTENNTPVAWAMTHKDLAIGALHVLESQRRRGLAEAAVAHICAQHSVFYQNNSPDPTTEHYVQAIVESSNTQSPALFRKLGWQTFGPGITWVVISTDNKAESLATIK
ncbi:hypothetical protein CLU79DRAFT_775919 [Phycomyces nitens]|nr:hypothetical protein CLU79DRAFT_775919 [Phycomyces nitens]